jgi:hypothetical protein
MESPRLVAGLGLEHKMVGWNRKGIPKSPLK